VRYSIVVTNWLAGTLLALWVVAPAAQTSEWPNYSGDPGHRKYAPLDQINRNNVANLRIAWRRPAVDPQLATRDPASRVQNNFRASPLMIGGILYSPDGIGLVEAFDATTGKTVRSTRRAHRDFGVTARGAWRTGRIGAMPDCSCSGATCSSPSTSGLGGPTPISARRALSI